MTTDQVETIWELLLAAFPAQVVEVPTQKLYRDHLRALPWRDGRTEADVRTLLVTHETAFLPPLSALLETVGVRDVTHRDGTNAVRQLVEAVRTGRELVPDLSTASGWAVGTASRPIPSLPEPDARPLRVLKPGDRPVDPDPLPEGAFTEEQRKANLKRLGAMARNFGAKKAAK